MHPRRSASPYRFAVPLVAACLALLTCHEAPAPLGPDACYGPIIAQVGPVNPVLNIGDTLTMRRSWNKDAARCWPPDTSARGVYWWTESGDSWYPGVPHTVLIDGVTGHLTALQPGVAPIYLSPHRGEDVVGSTGIHVLEPPTADSLISTIRNRTGDSARVVLQDASGAIQRSETIAANSMTCWVTPLPDSILYSATVYRQGGAATATQWLHHNGLSLTHTWFADVSYTTPPPTASLSVWGRDSPDPELCPFIPQVGVDYGPDTLHYEATAWTNVTDTSAFEWSNLSTSASVNQATTVTAGTATLTILDGHGTQVYARDLAESGTFTTSAGVGLHWTVRIAFTGYRGTVNFSIRKM